MRHSIIAAGLTVILAFGPVASFAQATTFSGEAVALRANALGVSLALSDTGALPSSGEESEYVSSERQCLGLGLG